ncbi:hypothetical protein D3C85_678840 [compost metagenome]
MQAENRIAPQFEEVVGDAHALDFQHLLPDRRQGFFQLGDRCHVVLTLLFNPRFRQGLAVELAVGRQRHARK